MTFTTKVLIGYAHDGDTGSSADSTLAKKISDAIAGQTIVSISVTRFGIYIAAVVVTSP